MDKLYSIGFNEIHNQYIKENNLQNFTIGRIINQQKDRFQVHINNGVVKAEITGNLRFSAKNSGDFPVIGDWVATIYSPDLSLIYKILPRLTTLERQSVNNKRDNQIIASNIDYVLIVQSVDHNFNLNRLERYLTITHSGKITPIIILNKIDLISEEELDFKIDKLNERISNVKVIPISTLKRIGVNQLNDILISRKTFCLLGSSGVGKSSIINSLLGSEILKTNITSDSNHKGQHTTTHKELLILKNGSLIIDTPGMRELGMLDSRSGLEETFNSIYELSKECKFVDCNHYNEPGCKVLEAIEKGMISTSELGNFKKLERESKRFEISKAEKRKKDKSLGKLYKKMINEKKSRR